MSTHSKQKLRIWRWVGCVLATALFGVGIWWELKLPGTGVASLFLAIGATLLPLFWDKLRPIERMPWVAMLFLLGSVEYRAIDKDRRETSEQQEKTLKSIGEGFHRVLDDQQKSFDDLISRSQKDFQATIAAFVDTQKKERRQFEALLKKDNQLFEHEEQLAEALDGKLIPGSEPTPSNACGEYTSTLKDQTGPRSPILVLVGTNAAIINKFPHTVLTVIDQSGRKPAIILDRSEDGSITVTMDVRSSDGRIIALLNKDGFVVNRNNYLKMRKGKSNLIVIDENGDEVLNANYVNRQVFSLNGTLHYPGVSVPLQATGSGNCMAALGNGTIDTDIVMDLRPYDPELNKRLDDVLAHLTASASIPHGSSPFWTNFAITNGGSAEIGKRIIQCRPILFVTLGNAGRFSGIREVFPSGGLNLKPGTADTGQCLAILQNEDQFPECMDIMLDINFALSAWPEHSVTKTFRFVGTMSGGVFEWKQEPSESVEGYCEHYVKHPF